MKVGIVDTTFSRVDMGRIAEKTLMNELPNTLIVRYTVPGIKDIPVAAKKLIEEKDCEAVITLGWVGKTLTDKISYAVASMSLQLVQLLTNKHVIDVTVHEDETNDPRNLRNIAIDRVIKHSKNLAILLRKGGKGLRPYAGRGLRQGYENAGSLEE